jgi:asparagine synthetase B (glutamine-hydrolysing)
MTRQLGLATDQPSTEATNDSWVLSLSLDEPGRQLPGGVRWAKRGPLLGFFHGLLFDREVLADSTGQHSDADLVLRAYERGGEAVLSRLRGSFVIAIIDPARNIAIVARDPVGSHPLFYVETAGRVLVSLTPQSLLDQSGVSRDLNRAALADLLCFRWPDRHETFFAAVRRVPPGWRAVISSGRIHLDQYWYPSPENSPVQWLTDQEAARFDEVFERAVSRCLHNGSTGIFLSGGLDSISVAAVATDCAHRAGQDPPLALSLGFPDPSCDERLRQTAVARDLGLRQYLLGFDDALGGRPLLEASQELNKTMSAPLLNPWAPPYLALARRASLDGIRTILTGQGGDEWLTVTQYLAADLIRRGDLVELAQFFATLPRSYQLSLLPLVRATFWTRGLRPLVGMARHRLMPGLHRASRLRRLLAGDPAWVSPDRELRAEQRHRAEGNLADPDPPHGFYERDLRVTIDYGSWELEEQYEWGRRIGVRFLRPFWDPDVVEMLYRMPPRKLNEGGRAKGVVRHMLARRFPGLELERQRKVLASSFYRSLLLRDGPALAERVGDFPALSALGVVDGRATRAFVLDGLKQPGSQLDRRWIPVTVETWVQSQIG